MNKKTAKVILTVHIAVALTMFVAAFACGVWSVWTAGWVSDNLEDTAGILLFAGILLAVFTPITGGMYEDAE